ncbi:MAG TPA: hypothetical protein PLZ79_13360, partial [Burkholderiales bacterium]|nr:hypothetical protein [Burkholderiales bacterium]
MSHRHLLAWPPSALALALWAGCASTQMAAEWMNKDFAGRSLKGERVFVACQGPDPTVSRLCEDEMANGLNTRGAIAVRPSASVAPAAEAPPGTPAQPAPAANLAAAKAAGAPVVLSMTVQPDSSVVNPGPTIGIGIGGGTWGGGGGFGGVGTSVGVPVGPATVQQGFAASTNLVETASGQIVWSGRAVSPPSDAFIRQLIDLNRVTFESMQ